MAGIWRLVAVLAVLMACVLVPFALWGDELDGAMTALLAGVVSPWALALFGFSLLVADVVLPVPSSIVSIVLCVALGPVAGGFVVLLGMIGAFLLGDGLGRILPADVLRKWIGVSLWEACVVYARKYGLLWLGVSRPVPVLAEMTSVIAGALAIPLRRSLPMVVASSACVAFAYGGVAWIGLRQENIGVAVAVAAVIPVLSWMGYRMLAGRGR